MTYLGLVELHRQCVGTGVSDNPLVSERRQGLEQLSEETRAESTAGLLPRQQQQQAIGNGNNAAYLPPRRPVHVSRRFVDLDAAQQTRREPNGASHSKYSNNGEFTAMTSSSAMVSVIRRLYGYDRLTVVKGRYETSFAVVANLCTSTRRLCRRRSHASRAHSTVTEGALRQLLRGLLRSNLRPNLRSGQRSGPALLDRCREAPRGRLPEEDMRVNANTKNKGRRVGASIP